jgi:hypothetical protein
VPRRDWVDFERWKRREVRADEAPECADGGPEASGWGPVPLLELGDDRVECRCFDQGVSSGIRECFIDRSARAKIRPHRPGFDGGFSEPGDRDVVGREPVFERSHSALSSFVVVHREVLLVVQRRPEVTGAVGQGLPGPAWGDAVLAPVESHGSRADFGAQCDDQSAGNGAADVQDRASAFVAPGLLLCGLRFAVSKAVAEGQWESDQK